MKPRESKSVRIRVHNPPHTPRSGREIRISGKSLDEIATKASEKLGEPVVISGDGMTKHGHIFALPNRLKGRDADHLGLISAGSEDLHFYIDRRGTKRRK